MSYVNKTAKRIVLPHEDAEQEGHRHETRYKVLESCIRTSVTDNVHCAYESFLCSLVHNFDIFI